RKPLEADYPNLRRRPGRAAAGRMRGLLEEGAAAGRTGKDHRRSGTGRVWKRNIGVGQGELYTNLQPALDGLTLYAADANGRVVSMDRDTGKVNWQVKLKEPLSGAVGAGGGRVMVGTLNGAMIVLDESDGSELWRTQVSSEVLAPPQTNGDIVVVQSQDDKLVALDISTGEQRWIYEASLPVLTVRGHSTPVVTLH